MSNETSYIENAQIENDELSSYSGNVKKAVAGAVTIVYAATQFGCGAISHSLGISEEGKLYKEVKAMTTWVGGGRDDYLAPRFDELSQAADKNKYNLDSLKVYKKAAEHLGKAREARNSRMVGAIGMGVKRAQEVRRNPNSVLKPRSKLTSKKPQAVK